MTLRELAENAENFDVLPRAGVKSLHDLYIDQLV